MSKMEDRKVPRLRFKGFEGEWEEFPLGNSIISSAFGPRFSSDLYSIDGNIAIISTTDMDDDGNVNYSGLTKAALNEDDFSSHFLREGDLVISRSGTIGVTAVYKNQNIHVVPGAFCIRFRVNEDRLNSKFVQAYFNDKKGRESLIRISAGGVQKNLKGSSVLALEVTFPTLPEQQKIATFLTAVDTKLQQLTRKLALLEQYKKGVMQQLFSGEVRFRDEQGEAFPGWEEKMLGEFLIPTFRAVDKPNGAYLAIGIRSHCKGTFQKVDEDPTKNAMDTLYEVKENDLIVNITFAWEGAIAMVKKEDEGGLVSHRFPTYTFNRNVAIGEFFQYVYPQKKFRLLLELISPGGAGRNRVMSKSEFLKLKWEIPSVPEQQKIAAFLSALDGRIAGVKGQLERGRAWKKGLLQGMFV
jgi:type I restriction enzyme S subunit